MKPKILVPFDFSATAERALAWAAELQRTTSGPRLHLVHAIPAHPAGTGEVAPRSPAPRRRRWKTSSTRWRPTPRGGWSSSTGDASRV